MDWKDYIETGILPVKPEEVKRKERVSGGIPLSSGYPYETHYINEYGFKTIKEGVVRMESNEWDSVKLNIPKWLNDTIKHNRCDIAYNDMDRAIEIWFDLNGNREVKDMKSYKYLIITPDIKLELENGELNASDFDGYFLCDFDQERQHLIIYLDTISK